MNSRVRGGRFLAVAMLVLALAAGAARAEPVAELRVSQVDLVTRTLWVDVVLVTAEGLANPIISYGCSVTISGTGSSEFSASMAGLRDLTAAEMVAAIEPQDYAWIGFGDLTNANGSGQTASFGHTDDDLEGVLAGDATGKVIARLAFHFSDTAYSTEGDVNGKYIDLTVGGYDPLGAWAKLDTADYVTHPVTVSNNGLRLYAIPEPATMGLVGMGLAALAAWRRRRSGRVAMLLLAGLTAGLLAAPASAQVVQWRGVNSSYATSLKDNDVGDVALWYDPTTLEYRLPTADDEVQLLYNSGIFIRSDLAIPVGSTFAARKLSMISGGYQDQLKMPLYLQKSLTLESIYLQFGYTSGGQGDQILRIGSPDTVASLLLRQVDQDAVTGTVTLTGASGSAAISFSALTAYDPTNSVTQAASRNTRRAEITTLINAATGSTDVQASGSGDLTLSSTTYGSAAMVKVVPGEGAVFRTTGTNANQQLDEVHGIDYVISRLTLTGPIPVDLASTQTGSIRTKWGTITLYAGSALVMNNPAITMIRQSQTSGSVGTMAGTGGTVEYTAIGGSIILQDPGISNDGVLSTGQHKLMVRSDQAWLNPSGVSFIRIHSPGNGNTIMEAIDGRRLDNMGTVAMFLHDHSIDRSSCTVPGGTYQGWVIYGDQTSGRWSYFDLAGDVTLAGAAVLAGNNNSTTPVYATADADYSLRVTASRAQKSGLRLTGNDLTTAKGILLRHLGSNSGDGCQIHASINAGSPANWSTLTINGPLMYDDGAAAALPSGASPTRSIGIAGDATTTINLVGNFSSTLRTMTGDSLSRATFNAVAGSAAAPQTIEVLDAPTSSFGASTGTFGELAVGNGVDAAYVKLVNNNRNDGGTAWQEEVLLARNLRVNAGATLNCNLGAIGGVKVSPPDKFAMQTTDYDVSMATGVHTIIGKKGSHSFDIDNLGGTTIAHFAEAVNAGTTATGVVCTISGSTAFVEAEGSGHDEFFIISGNIGTRNNSTKSERNAAGLFVDAAGTLDLNTGRLLAAGDKVMEFYSDGYQVEAWNTFKGRVIDSSNPELGFEAVAIDLQDYELNPTGLPIYRTVWAATSGEPEALDASVAIAPDFVYQNNVTTGGRQKAELSVTVNNALPGETFTVTVSEQSDATMFAVADTEDELVKQLVGGQRGASATGVCTFNVTVTSSLGRSVGPVAMSLTVRRLGDVNGDGLIEPTDKALLNGRINGYAVPVSAAACDLDGNGAVEPTDKGLLNSILNGVAIP